MKCKLAGGGDLWGEDFSPRAPLAQGLAPGGRAGFTLAAATLHEGGDGSGRGETGSDATTGNASSLSGPVSPIFLLLCKSLSNYGMHTDTAASLSPGALSRDAVRAYLATEALNVSLGEGGRCLFGDLKLSRREAVTFRLAHTGSPLLVVRTWRQRR